ncbi:MAG: DUF4038 domain-containing protein, partial [bacterium]|nr:DUF4038 domain-containing protein [bacterium]
YHPRGGGRSSSEHLHREPWLDFHMIQTGPGSDKYFPGFAKVAEDFALRPVKPTLLAEPVYENAYKNSVDRRYDAYDVRQAAYWAVFAGAFGHTYGGLETWQLLNPGIERLNRKITTGYWYDLLDLPGAMSLKHLRALIESRPLLRRIPDQSMVINPGTGREHIRATRAFDGSYAFVYAPTGRDVEIDLTKLSGTTVKAQWYNPRDGSRTAAAEFAPSGVGEFTPPSDTDWVLVLERSE